MPYITLSKVSDGLDSYFNSLDRALSTQVFQNKLPLLGNGLSNSSSNQFVSRMRSSVQRELQAITSSGAYYSSGVEVGEIGKALFKALGNESGGLGILQDLDGNGIINAADVQITDRQTSTGSGYGGYVDFNLKLKQSPALFDVPISKDLGLSKLGLTLDGNARASIGYLYNLNFGLEFSGVGYSNNDGFYVETAASNELEIVLAATTPNSNITGKLGLLQVQAKDQGTELKGRVSASKIVAFNTDLLNRMWVSGRPCPS